MYLLIVLKCELSNLELVHTRLASISLENWYYYIFLPLCDIAAACN